jgi:hypothetical protein
VAWATAELRTETRIDNELEMAPRGAQLAVVADQENLCVCLPHLGGELGEVEGAGHPSTMTIWPGSSRHRCCSSFTFLRGGGGVVRGTALLGHRWHGRHKQVLLFAEGGRSSVDAGTGGLPQPLGGCFASAIETLR